MKPPDRWTELRQFTAARIALGRVGSSLPTQALLQFGLAHAQARDAVYHRFDTNVLAQDLRRENYRVVEVESLAADRQHYLLRPDYGRRLNAASKQRLQSFAPPSSSQFNAPQLVFIVADGLAPQAPLTLAIPLLNILRAELVDWTIAPVVIASQARVALSDEIGAILGAEIVVMLIGERPGLSSPCSLGAYLTYSPRPGRSDAERNCVSNIHAGGLSSAAAAAKLIYLLRQARVLKISGIPLTEDSDQIRLRPSDN